MEKDSLLNFLFSQGFNKNYKIKKKYREIKWKKFSRLILDNLLKCKKYRNIYITLSITIYHQKYNMEDIISLAKTRRIGGSLVVTIPAEIVKDENIAEGEVVEIKVRKRKTDYLGALKGIGSFKKEDRMKDRY